MSKDLDRERGSPCYLQDEISTAADDTVSRPRSIYGSHLIYPNDVDQVGDKHKRLTFMDLPREIRNMIYQKALTRPDGKFFVGTKHSNELWRNLAVLGNTPRPSNSLSDEPEKHGASTRNLALLRTSKAIHAEAGAIIYGQELVFTDLVDLQNFLAGLRPLHISLLRHVVLAPVNSLRRHIMRPLMPSVFSLLAGADSLETLDPDIEVIGHAAIRLENSMIPCDAISTAAWDSVVGRAIAAEVYCHLFTYLRRAVAVRGIDKVLDVLHVFPMIFLHGPDHRRAPCQPRNILGVEWTQDRKAVMKKAMGEEIERLLEKDNN